MKTTALFLAIVSLALGGCASPVALSVLGGGTSALVQHNLNSSVDRAFDAPLPVVRRAALAALDHLNLPRDGGDAGDADTLRAATAERSLAIAFESLSPNLTLMRASVRRNGLTLDHATAHEIIKQTERLLATAPVAQASVATRPVFVVRLATVPASEIDTLRPVPSSLQDYALFMTEGGNAGRRLVSIKIGYFLEEAEALAAQRVARQAFPGASIERSELPAARFVRTGI